MTTTVATEPPRYRRIRAGGYAALGAWSARMAVRNRSALLLNSLGSVIQLVVAFFLWRTYFATNETIGPYDEDQIRLFLLASLVMNTILGGYDEWRNALRVLNGDVAVDLVRPLSYGPARLVELVGTGLAELVLMTGVAVVVGLLVGGAGVPLSMVPAVVLTAILATVVKAQVVCCSILLCFGRDNYLGLHWTRLGVMTLFAGVVVPVDLYPGWLREIALALPLQAVVYAPFRVLTAGGWTPQVADALVRQVLSVLVMALVMAALGRRAMRRVETVG